VRQGARAPALAAAPSSTAAIWSVVTASPSSRNTTAATTSPSRSTICPRTAAPRARIRATLSSARCHGSRLSRCAAIHAWAISGSTASDGGTLVAASSSRIGTR